MNKPVRKVETAKIAQPIKKMDAKALAKLSDEEIQGLFEEAFIAQVGSYNGIAEVEAKCNRELGKAQVQIELTIQGLAGTPTAEDFKKSKVDRAGQVTISRDDKGSLTFTLMPKETVYLNSTEYIVTYQAG